MSERIQENLKIAEYFCLRNKSKWAIPYLNVVVALTGNHPPENVAYMFLKAGQFQRGWALFEFRDRGYQNNAWLTLDCLWRGQSLMGSRLLLLDEQGCGDMIMFARYVKELKALGVAHLTVVVRPQLIRLFRSMREIDYVDEKTEVGHYDYWMSLLDAPLRLGTNPISFPNALPYLYADSGLIEHWKSRVPVNGFRVGLVWRGSGEYINDAVRSLPNLNTLAPLWKVSDVQFVSLQKGPGEYEAASPPVDQPLLHLGSELEDFADTAAIIAQLDLIISVDTAVAHLAGALGKPVWVLLPGLSSCWRWLDEGNGSHWYPSVMRLFRQSMDDAEKGDWSKVVDDVAQALREKTKKRRWWQ